MLGCPLINEHCCLALISPPLKACSGVGVSWSPLRTVRQKPRMFGKRLWSSNHVPSPPGCLEAGGAWTQPPPGLCHELWGPWAMLQAWGSPTA